MTREEQILNKAIDYSEIEENFLEFDDCGDVCNDKTFIEKAFIEGAKWADKTMLDKNLVYTKKELMDMGFGFDTNGNIRTPQEIEESHKKHNEYRKNRLIEKACEYLRVHLWQNIDDDNDPIVESVHNITLDNFIKDFKRYVEE